LHAPWDRRKGIRKLDIDFGKGTFAISGPNGSGKSATSMSPQRVATIQREDFDMVDVRAVSDIPDRKLSIAMVLFPRMTLLHLIGPATALAFYADIHLVSNSGPLGFRSNARAFAGSNGVRLGFVFDLPIAEIRLSCAPRRGLRASG
jgi:hypothetical protein